MLFAVYIAEWQKKARTKTSDSWKIGQDQVLRCHVLPYLLKKDLRRITPSDIADVMEASKSKGHSPNQQKKVYMVMSKVFADAIEFFEYIEKSPVKKKFHLPKVPPVKRTFMSFEQAIIFLEYVMHHPLFSEAAWIMTLTGIRISEMQALEWSDVCFEKDQIEITKSYCPSTKSIRPFTKNGGHYAVPIPPMLKAFLWSRRKKAGFIGKNQTGGMLNREGFKMLMKRASIKLNLPIGSSHGLRHTCARIYVEKGARDEEIKELLGHKSLASSKTYTHRDDLKILKNISKKIA